MTLTIAKENWKLVDLLAMKYAQTRDHAEEIRQNSWVRILRSKKGPRRICSSWFAAVVRNTANDFYRLKNKEAQLLNGNFHVSSTSVVDAGEGEVEAVAEDRDDELLLDLYQVLERLPAQQREALLLCCEGLNYPEIAILTGSKIGTVRSRIHYGRNFVRKHLLTCA